MADRLTIESALIWSFDRVLLSARRPLEQLDQRELAAVVASAATAFCFSSDQHNPDVYRHVREEIRANLPKEYLSWQKLRNA